jgi:NAD-dependent dihydropyrimidine dehydrogenase PreA subunit
MATQLERQRLPEFREKQRAYQASPAGKAAKARSKRKLKDWIRTHKDGALCLDCEHTYPQYVLEWHHRNPAEKRFEVGQAQSKTAALAEMDKCDLLCANCHRIRTYRKE